MANFDDMKLAVEALTGGKNTVILDDMDMPSIMVRWEKQKNNAIISGGSDVVHPGSIVNGVEKTMYVSKYQNIVVNGRAYSLPFQDPANTINFDNALAACRTKKTTGGSWCLTPYALWAQIALWARKNGTMPRGNNQCGHDISYTHEKGTPTSYEGASHATHPNEPARCATGSGPATWNHNWLPDGIADMNGNVWEWCAGLRLNNGEIQVIPYANVMDPDVSLAAGSTYWKAIAADGSLVAPGTAGTLKYDSTFKIVQTLTAATGTPSGEFKSLGKADGLTIPELAKALILYPDEPNGDYGGDYHYWNVEGERLPFCGGYWNYGAHAGVFYVYLYYPRSIAGGSIGFRSAFCEM